MEGVMINSNGVRVRFAPSPTGFLHVGGARTAIFNWLYAKKRNGKFLLRIEDTDPIRSKSELSEQIIRSLKWLNMLSDEPVVYQSDRIQRYKEVIMELVKNKKAYYAFETSGELEQKRKEAQIKKIPYKYDRTALKLSQDEINQFLENGKEYTIRFMIPDGITEFNDMVHGKTTFNNSEIDDFVILRSDGSPVYHIAVVVDDHNMQITHVIRGDDHLSNTPKQILLYKALGWILPQFAHLPMIFDEEKRKLSKRKNTVSVEEYNSEGYLPEALFNFLTLLGYAPPDNKEIISRDELVNIFSFSRVNKKSAVFDLKKLKWINSEYVKMADEKVIASMVMERLIAFLADSSKIDEIIPSENSQNEDNESRKLKLDYILKVVHLMKERVSTVNDFINFGKYFFIDPDTYDEKGVAKYWNSETQILLNDYLEVIKNSESNFTSMKLEEKLRIFAASKNVNPARIIHPLRLALTGITISPGIFELMEVLGKDCVLRRIVKIIFQSK